MENYAKMYKSHLKGSCEMRWYAKHVAEEIKETLNAELMYEAAQLLHAVKNFEFIINLIIWANIRREINRVNVQIQKEDIILARSTSWIDLPKPYKK